MGVAGEGRRWGAWERQADVIVAASAVELLNIQPWGSIVDLFHPHCEIEGWDFELKLRMARRAVVLGLDVLDDVVRDPFHLLHGDLVISLATIFVDFNGCLFY